MLGTGDEVEHDEEDEEHKCCGGRDDCDDRDGEVADGAKNEAAADPADLAGFEGWVEVFPASGVVPEQVEEDASGGEGESVEDGGRAKAVVVMDRGGDDGCGKGRTATSSRTRRLMTAKVLSVRWTWFSRAWWLTQTWPTRRKLAM
jgi:hypothetical protein